MSSCCHTDESTTRRQPKPWHQQVDWIFWGSLLAIALSLLSLALSIGPDSLQTIGAKNLTFIRSLWWSVLLSILAIGVMNFIPPRLYEKIIGDGQSTNGLLRAIAGGLTFDLCSHGILMVGAKLYKQGASLGQLFAFLITSPWNSFSMMLILASLTSWRWTLLFLALSAFIGFVTGLLINGLVKLGWLPDNHPKHDSNDNEQSEDAHFNISNASHWPKALWQGLQESTMVLRWLFLGLVMASIIQTFVSTTVFTQWFGPTLAGLGLTLVAATIIEVCSEGSIPIAADLLTRAGAPGNAFTFLMAGASTDITELMVLRDTTKRWAVALAMPLLTVPQILLLGWIINQANSTP
jgi:uncharacterized membrane protein YraQ (UPF0718 family)